MLKKIILTLVVVATCSVSGTADASEKKVALSSSESTINWTGKKVTGQHSGTVALKSGEINLDGDTLKNGKFEIDVNRVVVADITDPKFNAKLVGHLKSPDFFSTESFPVVEFFIEKATKLPNPKSSGENYMVDGKLKIKGIEQAVSFPATIQLNESSAEAKGKVTLDRTKWDIRYGSGKFFQGLGDKLIYDDFEVEFAVKGKIG